MIRKLLMAVLLLAIAQPALADGPIAVRKGRPFTHERTGTNFPGKIAGLKLTRLHDFSENQYDVAAIYGGIGDGDEISVYLYRAAIPDVSLWTGMVVNAMQYRPQFRPAEPEDAVPRFFSPPGSATASAMRMAYNTVPGQYAATGVALVPHGSWLLKVRITSTTRNAAEIDALIDKTLAEFPLSESTGAGPAYAIQPCPDQLSPPPAAPTDPKSENFNGALIGAAMNSIVFSDDTMKELDSFRPTKRVIWCEDTVYESGVRTYRPDGRQDFYIIALSDAGTHIAVGQLGPLLKNDDTPRPVPVVERTSQSDIVRALFDTLPTPDQAWQANESGVALANSDRDSNIKVNSSFFSTEAE